MHKRFWLGDAKINQTTCSKWQTIQPVYGPQYLSNISHYKP